MCLREYSEEEIKEMFKKEGKIEGIEEGKKEGIKEGIEESRIISVKNMIQELNITLERAMDILKIPVGDRKKIEEGVKKALSENE